MKETLECGECKGSGWVGPTYYRSHCKNCDGTGELVPGSVVPSKKSNPSYLDKAVHPYLEKAVHPYLVKAVHPYLKK